MNNFHNTTNLDGTLEGAAREKARVQDQIISQFFYSNPTAFTADQVWALTELDRKGVPITSVRRAMSNLSRTCKYCGGDLKKSDSLCCQSGIGILVKTDEQATSIYGARAYKWIHHQHYSKWQTEKS